MPHRSMARLFAAWFLLSVASGCNRSNVKQREFQSEFSPVVFGLTESKAHRNIVEAAIYLANVVLEIDTPYKLAPSWKKAPADTILVYLVDGETLEDSEYVFVPKECIKCIFVQASRLPALFELFGVDYEAAFTMPESGPDYQAYQAFFNMLPEQRPAYRAFFDPEHDPNRDVPILTNDEARRMLALVFLHEVGHVSRGQIGSYTGLQPISFREIEDIAGPTKNVELAADRFAAERLRSGPDLSVMMQGQISIIRGILSLSPQEQQRQIEELSTFGFVTQQRKEGIRMRATTDLISVLPIVAVKLADGTYPNLHPAGPRGTYTHLDLDLRLLIIYDLVQPHSQLDKLVRSELQLRTGP